MKYTINLATGTYINRRSLYFYLGILTILLLSVFVMNTFSVFRDLERSQSVDKHLQELRTQSRSSTQSDSVNSADYAKIALQIEAANQVLLRDSYRWTELLDDLEGVLAEGISIRDLQPDYKTGIMKLSGFASNIEDLQLFVDNLNRSVKFSHVYLKEQRQIKSKDGVFEGINFTIELKRRSTYAS